MILSLNFLLLELMSMGGYCGFGRLGILMLDTLESMTL